MLDQLAIVRKHALCAWKNRQDGVLKTIGAIHGAAKVAHGEIEELPKSPVVFVLSILQVIYLIHWLVTIVWPRRPPQETDEDELESMRSALSA